MTEHDKSSAVVEETGRLWTTPQSETTEKTVEKKNGSNKTSLALRARLPSPLRWQQASASTAR